MRFSLLLLFTLIISAPAQAEPLSVEQIAAQAKLIQEQARVKGIDELLPERQQARPQDKLVAAEILVASREIVETAMAEEAKKLEEEGVLKAAREDPRVRVFITLGEAPDYRHGRKMLKAMVGMRNDVIIMLRGLPDGIRQFDKAAKLVRAIVGDDYENLPPVDIDPVRFEQYSITQSPTLIYEREKQEIARLSGQLSHSYLRRKVEKNNFTGDLGQLGTTTEVVEIDLIEDIKQRIAQIDWVEKKKRARTNYWKKKEFRNLPAAAEDRTFSIRPEFEISQNIYDHKGNVLIPKGERVNVLEETMKVGQRPFYLVVFDGSDTAQVEMAKQLIADAPKDHQIIRITTTLSDIDHGWDEFENLQNQLKAAVYVLDERFVNTFGLQHVPCTVQPVGSEYVIQEYRRTL